MPTQFGIGGVGVGGGFESREGAPEEADVFVGDVGVVYEKDQRPVGDGAVAGEVLCVVGVA